MKPSLWIAAIGIVMATPLTADEFSAALEEFYQAEVSSFAADEALIAAVTAQNVETSGYSLEDIEALDKKWRAEVGTSATPTITPVLENAAAEILRERVAAYGGRITEIFVMDAQGLNVAASSVTSDYWQGDEAKHSETFGVGPGSLHISDVELDESTQRYQGQISFPIVDPASGDAIGAITVGVDAQSLM